MIDATFITNLIKTNFNITPTCITELNTSGTMNMVYLVEFNNRKLIIDCEKMILMQKMNF